MVQGNNVFVDSWRRATTITTVIATVPDGYYVNCQAYFLVLNDIKTNIWAASWTITEDPNNSQCPAEPKYDCINGVCALATAYNTPGSYASLADCQSACGVSSPGCAAPNLCIDPNNYCPLGRFV
ncbi:MAG: hypothetical protein KME21_13400 [Desmonostoc vinosum HA7617-LM4]|jgi:hypothetical protein|nr:hypothetical protein [Desmonostoc vinosum HA7617-LM4]